ncbi:MAG: NAD(P)H-dependent oxidoreductase [Nocardioidaceae bacterium]
MNVLWIYAHPEPRSLSGALKTAGLRTLGDLGHDVRESDLYAMGWKATVDQADFTDREPGERLVVGRASKHAHHGDSLTDDIRAEQDKLDWADAVVFQFPLWWYGMPAILRGWFDRVFVKGYAYGVVDPDRPGRTLRYGEGNLAGKRALVLTTTGSRAPAFGPRGINGQLDQALFPLLHGTLWYTGMQVLEPLAVYGADHLSDGQFADATQQLCDRLTSLGKEEPIAYRHQNRGAYDDDLVLRPEFAPGSSGLGVHIES